MNEYQSKAYDELNAHKETSGTFACPVCKQDTPHYHSHDQASRERDALNVAQVDDRIVDNRAKWDLRFLRLAAEVATWSKDPSTQVGSVIVCPIRAKVSLGFNGFPRGMSDAPELYNEREVKYSRTVHSELNAILNAEGSVRGHTIYCSAPPCSNCALHIIQAGIARVVSYLPTPDLMSRWADSIARTNAFCTEAGVKTLWYPQ